MNKLDMDMITEKFQKRFDQAEKNIVSLTNKAENASEDMKNEINNRVKTIRKKQMEAKKQLDEIKESSESAWSKLQKGVSHSLDSLEVAIQQAKGEFE